MQSNWKLSDIAVEDAKWYIHSPLLTVIWQLSINFIIFLPYDPAIPPPVIYPREIRTSVHTEICT